MLANCLPGLLPQLTDELALEVALVGGGSGTPVPGELSLAHRGVLFLDELGEFPPNLLDSLRQPLESGYVTIARKGVSVRFPSTVQLIAATNPCPCGYLGDQREPCRCTPRMLERYQRRLLGPLVDRFDMRIRIDRTDPAALIGAPGERTENVRCRVEFARERQRGRGQDNAVLGRPELDAMPSTPEAIQLVEHVLCNGRLTGRGFDRVRRIARTIADLADATEVGEPHVAEALVLRGDS